MFSYKNRLNHCQGNFFYVSKIYAIDSLHKINSGRMISGRKIETFSIFASIHPNHTLNQGQGSVFTLRECAQSISRIKLPLYKKICQFGKKNFWHKTIGTHILL